VVLPLPLMGPLVVAVPVHEQDGCSDELDSCSDEFPGVLLEPNFVGDAPTCQADV
jgi:hypothetical protein